MYKRQAVDGQEVARLRGSHAFLERGAQGRPPVDRVLDAVHGDFERERVEEEVHALSLIHIYKVVMVGPFGEYPDMTRYALPTMCQQCEDAPCVHVCPTGASYRDEEGKVLIDREKCIGCKYCMMACQIGRAHV